ncbi:hypothetical protein B0A48_11836 [Cryoendolithus antarcticus]|uniref:Mitochondrial pyruvate carrier n=1 Tax=Cryoendolithus antarcticus TaxID=1507870 RepID=A0A1V8STS1_9PEZI|nr:hypothetical protein B0A48_11836 [Cryoendolithus antarcticus]
MSSRFGLRALRAQNQIMANLRAQRRYNSTAIPDATGTVIPPKRTGFDAFWNSTVGPKTVHFWAPIMKWGLVLAGASNFARPAEKLSLSQNAALMCTGLIWTRWCFVIRPKNMFLASVNFLLFCVGAAQTGRVLNYQAGLKGKNLGEEIVDEVKEGAKKVEMGVERGVEKVSQELK